MRLAVFPIYRLLGVDRLCNRYTHFMEEYPHLAFRIFAALRPVLLRDSAALNQLRRMEENDLGSKQGNADEVGSFDDRTSWARE